MKDFKTAPHQNTQRLYNIYQQATPVLECNVDKSESYWFDAIHKTENTQIKLSFQDYDITYVSAPMIIVPQTLFGRFLGLYIRSFDGETQQNLPALKPTVYTAQASLNNKQTDKVFISEGVMDAEAIATFDVPSVACMKAVPSYLLLLTLTSIYDKMIFIPDNDGEGQESQEKFRKKCYNINKWVDFKIVEINDFADPGEVFEFGFDSYEYNLLRQKVELALDG